MYVNVDDVKASPKNGPCCGAEYTVMYVPHGTTYVMWCSCGKVIVTDLVHKQKNIVVYDFSTGPDEEQSHEEDHA